MIFKIIKNFFKNKSVDEVESYPSTYSGTSLLNFRYLILLSLLYMSLSILSGLMIYKIIDIYHFIEPGGIIIFPLTYFITNVITEVYGYKVSRHLIWCGNFCSIIFVIFSSIIIHLPSPSFWNHQNDFNQIFGFMPRVMIAGLLGNTFGLFLNTYLVSKMKLKLEGKYYWFRSLSSTILGEIGYTIFSVFIMYFGWMPLGKIFQLMMSILIFKIGYSILANPFECMFATIVKRKEKVDIYDYRTKFTPFKFGLDVSENKKLNLYVVKSNL